MELDALIYEVIVDANGEDEQLWAFRQAFEDALSLPADGFVIGEPVAAITFDYDGNERRGLTARCRRENGSEHVVAAAEVAFPANTNLSRNFVSDGRFCVTTASQSMFLPTNLGSSLRP